MRIPARIKGIIFDMDGVLLDSSSIHEQAFRDVLAAQAVDRFEYRGVAGMRTDEALRRVLTENGISYSDELIASLAAAKSRRAREAIVRENPVDPRWKDVLEGLARDYRLGLASSASEATVNLFLDQNGLRVLFECVLHGGDVRLAKPAPDIYALACERLRLAPAECLIVEDAAGGVRAGKAAGAVVWGIPTTYTAAELEACGADGIIGSAGDLLELVKRR
jgi:beta-phosphoglucomutase